MALAPVLSAVQTTGGGSKSPTRVREATPSSETWSLGMTCEPEQPEPDPHTPSPSHQPWTAMSPSSFNSR